MEAEVILYRHYLTHRDDEIVARFETGTRVTLDGKSWCSCWGMLMPEKGWHDTEAAALEAAAASLEQIAGRISATAAGYRQKAHQQQEVANVT